MKKSAGWFILLTMAVFSLTACDPEENLPGTGDPVILKTLPAGASSTIANFPYDSLSASEIEGILLLREEELLAHDVYTAFLALYPGAPFSNIATSELTHTELVQAIINKYSLADPGAGHVEGVFINQDLQSLYTNLVATGSGSLQAALAVGALIEETDIADLDDQLALLDGNADIQFVYGKLRTGSINHLKAFVKKLQQQFGVVYVPQVLSAADYSALVSQSTTGNPGGIGTCGQGSGIGMSQGQGLGLGHHGTGSCNGTADSLQPPDCIPNFNNFSHSFGSGQGNSHSTGHGPAGGNGPGGGTCK